MHYLKIKTFSEKSKPFPFSAKIKSVNVKLFRFSAVKFGCHNDIQMSTSLKFSRFKFSKNTPSLMSYMKSSMFKSAQELSDVGSVVIYCPSDATLLVVLDPANNEYWIPSVKITGGNSWLSQITGDLIQDIFGCNVPVSRLMRVNRVWIPRQEISYICHAVFEIQATAEMKKKSKVFFGKFKTKLRWITEEELNKFSQNNLLKSPELLDFMCYFRAKSFSHITIPTDHLTTTGFTEISDILVTGKNSIYEQIIDASGIDRAAQEILYREFLLLSFPAIFVTMQVFAKFALDVGWTKEDIPHLYRSADLNNRNGISFREFLYFLAAVEPGTTHGGVPAELRCRYIFRYLDTDKNNLLKRDEMKNFICLVRKARKQPIDQAKVEKELSECYQSIGIPETQSLSMADFLKGVGELKIRGTSQIYRAPNSIQKYVKELSSRNEKNQDGSPNLYDGKVASAYAKVGAGYEMAVHSVKIQKSGNTINLEHLWNIESGTSHSSGLPKVITDANRKKSTDQFDQQSKSNELLKALRYLTQMNRKQQCYGKVEGLSYNWGLLDSSTVAKHLISVCQEVKDIFVQEPRMLSINSPVYIMGDLHGNFADLLYFERMLWHVGPGLCPCSLLFLGDYVDRGVFSVEVISYLFSYKLQNPRKLKMLRGNHEIKRVQQQWTFEKECKIKFGDRLGNIVFNAVNDAFDTMPLAAVIDGRVFCCHGGIPPPWLCPVATAINDIPAILTDPQDQSSLAWELMWNDPIRSKTITDKIAMELLANEGFAVNSRRGTAHIFSVEALEKFLHANGFTHLVRAHEVVEAGFFLQQKGRLLTIFSSSKYCGGQNTAACILADQGKLRVLRLETE